MSSGRTSAYTLVADESSESQIWSHRQYIGQYYYCYSLQFCEPSIMITKLVQDSST